VWWERRGEGGGSGSAGGPGGDVGGCIDRCRAGGRRDEVRLGKKVVRIEGCVEGVRIWCHEGDWGGIVGIAGGRRGSWDTEARRELVVATHFPGGHLQNVYASNRNVCLDFGQELVSKMYMITQNRDPPLTSPVGGPSPYLLLALTVLRSTRASPVLLKAVPSYTFECCSTWLADISGHGQSVGLLQDPTSTMLIQSNISIKKHANYAWSTPRITTGLGGGAS
jgi:hypothetical protein